MDTREGIYIGGHEIIQRYNPIFDSFLKTKSP